MSTPAPAIVPWVVDLPFIDGLLFGSSDGEVAGPPICAVAVAGHLRGYGKGHTHSQALASAVGEVLEQIAAHHVDRKRLICASFAELESQAFDPRWLGLYSDQQYARPDFPYRPFDPHVSLHWLEGRWLDTGERVYLPAFAVYLSSELTAENLCQVTSSGLGAGPSLADAVEHAALELYERDAFLTSWTTLSPKRRVHAPDHAGILAHLKFRGATTEVYLLSQSPAFVALAVARGDGIRWPAITLGLGAARNQSRAIDKAILELGQTSPYLARVWRQRELPLPANPQQIKNLPDHALYYCDLAHRGEFENWLTAPQKSLVEISKPRIAVADVTPPALQDSLYHVVRALGQCLRSIHVGYGFERLSSQRVINPAPSPLC